MAGKIEPVEYYENPILKKDGTQRIIAWHNAILKDSNGDIVGSLNSGNDITEQTQTEKALRESEKKYRNILEDIEDSYLETDLKGNFKYYNPSFCKLLGCTKAELAGKNNLEFLDKKNAEKALKIFNEIYKTGEPIADATWEFTRQDGGKRHIEASISLAMDEKNKPIGFQGFGRDITDRKKSEVALHKAKEEWEQTFDAVQDLIMIIDSNHRIIRVNKTMADRLGMSSEEMIGQACYEIVHGTGKPLELCPHSLLLKDHMFHTAEVREERLDGDFIVTVSPLINSKGGLMGSVHVAHDITQRKKAEKILAQNESRFRDISLSMADWIWEIDLKGRYVFSAGNSKKTLGYDNDELLGKTPFDFMPKDEALKIKKSFMEIISKKQPIVDLKNWNLRKDGTRVCLLTNGVPIIDDDGELTGYRGIDKDITKTLEIEEKLKQSLEVTEKIIDNIPIGMVIVGEDKMIQRINKAALAMTGYDTKEEILGLSCHQNICPAKKGKCPITDLGQVVDQSEKTIICKDGRLIPVYKTAMPLEIDGQDVIIEAFMDITLLKETEKALLESRERLRIVMETIVDPVVVYDDQGKVTYLNPAFTRVFGWSFDELLGQRIDFVQEEEKAETQKAIAKIFQGEGLTGFETRRTTKNNKMIDVRIGAALLLDTLGKPNGIVVNFQDITQEKKAQDKLNQMNQELEKAIKQANIMAHRAEIANIAKSEFLANMSHEIRTPLNGVIGMTGLLLDTDLSHEQQHYVNTVQNSGESLLAVINDILDFSKIEAGKLEMESIDFDLRSMLDHFASMMSLRVQEKNLEFLCAASPDVPALVQGDPGRLRQILTNLVGNAVKFTAKGEVSVRAYLEKETNKDITLLFSIKDTGIGIPEEKHDLLFQSFTQADASTTREFGGTGLGLTISKKLCEKMGGKIGLNSEVGKGSEFWFTARFNKQEEPASYVMPVQRPDMTGHHILVVDDNKTNREILLGQLGSWGLRVKEAKDGPGALHEFYQAENEKDPFQIAILDMQMPGMDGLSLGRIIKSDDKLKSVHLIMMTSIGQAGDAKRFEKAGFAAYLMKPVGHSELFDCLSTIISGGSKPQVETPIITRHTVREQQRKNIRILLAEDNITNQQVATGILKNFGFVGVKTVLNGAQAVKELEAFVYDLVLMDIQMPEMDGHEACRQIRKIESESNKKRIPVIAMTAHAMKEDRDKCLEAGMDDYVSKPVNAKALLEALERWLPKEKPVSASPATAFDQIPKKEIKTENNLMVFDKNALMDRLMGDVELFETVVSGFLDDMPKQIGVLTKHINQNNTEDAGRQGHQIKGASGNMGAEALRKIASEIEIAGKAGDSDRLILLLPQLEKAFYQLKKAMEEII
jgi:PAS domain S-box-containing protein